MRSRIESLKTPPAMMAIALMTPPCPRNDRRRWRATCSTKTSSSVPRSGLSETMRAPPLTRSAMSCSGTVEGGSSSEKRPSPSGVALRDARLEARQDLALQSRHDQLPAARSDRGQLVERADRREPSFGENRDAAAQRFRIAQHVRAEEHGAAAIAQAKNQLADLAAAERIEPRHRLVEEHELGLVDERLGDADALHHALRKLAQLKAPLGADADLVQQTRGALPPLLRGAAEQPREVDRAAPLRSGCRRSTGSRAGSRSGA